MSTPSGQRQLAAIVFTDIAAFAVHVGRDEAKTLAQAESDFQLITALFEKHGGQVVKRTGDGLLACFASAVEAVQASIASQNALYAASKLLAPAHVLHHRIGIHLGDVVQSADDVLGDGVNIAQRIQNEAKPGGIAMSATTYEVIRGKVDTPATCLGPRSLKHIVEPIVVWQMMPNGVMDAAGTMTKAIPQDMLLEFRPETQPKTGLKALAYVFAAAAIMVVPIYLLMTSLKSVDRTDRGGKVMRQDGNEPESGSPNETAEDGASKKSNSIEQVVPETEGSTANPQPSVSDQSQADLEFDAGAPSATDAEEESAIDTKASLRATIAEMRSRYAFDEIADLLSKEQGEGPAWGRMIERYTLLGELIAWTKQAWVSTPKDQPVQLKRLNGLVRASLFGENGKMMAEIDGQVSEVALEKTEPKWVASAMSSLMQNATSDRPKMLRALAMFAREFSLSRAASSAATKPTN